MELDTEKLYRMYYFKVYSFAVTLAKNREAAEEITQETFFRALRSKNAFRGQASEFSYLCAIAKNIFFDSERRRKNEEPLQDEPFSDGPESSVVQKDESFRIHRVLHTLEEPYKEVFELRVFGELSFAQIASIFGKTESWARSTYHRARLKIKERME